jgi:hypothetical protein
VLLFFISSINLLVSSLETSQKSDIVCCVAGCHLCLPILTVHRKLNFGGTIRVFEGKYGYLLRGQITSTDFRLLLDMQKRTYCNKICDKHVYSLKCFIFINLNGFK